MVKEEAGGRTGVETRFIQSNHLNRNDYIKLWAISVLFSFIHNGFPCNLELKMSRPHANGITMSGLNNEQNNSKPNRMKKKKKKESGKTTQIVSGVISSDVAFW